MAVSGDRDGGIVFCLWSPLQDCREAEFQPWSPAGLNGFEGARLTLL